MKPVLAAIALLALTPAAAFAWAETGHRMVAALAAEALPDETPAFLREASSVWRLGELGREPDRSRSAGQPHDADLDAAHFIDGDDAGLVLGGPPLSALPATRAAYEAALQAAGTDSWKAGYLPYSIIEGWQHLVKDFAYWRVDSIGERTAETADQRAWFAADRRLREEVILRDLGHWGHFVADGSNPMHVTVHYNGWGPFPNPKGYTQDRIHLPFEGAFVRARVAPEAVRAAMAPPRDGAEPVASETTRYLMESYALVEPLYALWTEGGFEAGDGRGLTFATDRLAAAASELRDLTVAAWRASADSNVGYPPVRVSDIEASQSVPFDRIYGRE